MLLACFRSVRVGYVEAPVTANSCCSFCCEVETSLRFNLSSTQTSMPFPGVMPANLDMILSASPPLFAHHHGPFSQFHLSYPRAEHNKYFSLNRAARLNAVNATVHLAPIRPCLMLKEDDSPRDSKKRVWFADDKGLALTHVKIMTEPSHCPPRWSENFLDYITNGIKALPISEHVWEVTFTQPASDYLEFRQRLDRDCVTLENAMVSEETVSGTVKVRNLSFHKEVFIRLTFDRWMTHKDITTEYVPSGLDTSSPYDTFKFSAEIPPSAVKFGIVELCIGFRCDGQEYWDSNNGSNYRLRTVMPKKPDESRGKPKFNDAFVADMNHWTEFASWHHLVNETPYW